MEINSKIQVEQPTPPGVPTAQRSQKRDGQTNKKLNVFGRHGGGWNPSPTILGMVIEENLEHVLAPLKRLGVWRIVSPLRAVEGLAETWQHQLKTPITP